MRPVSYCAPSRDNFSLKIETNWLPVYPPNHPLLSLIRPSPKFYCIFTSPDRFCRDRASPYKSSCISFGNVRLPAAANNTTPNRSVFCSSCSIIYRVKISPHLSQSFHLNDKLGNRDALNSLFVFSPSVHLATAWFRFRWERHSSGCPVLYLLFSCPVFGYLHTLHKALLLSH